MKISSLTLHHCLCSDLPKDQQPSQELGSKVLLTTPNSPAIVIEAASLRVESKVLRLSGAVRISQGDLILRSSQAEVFGELGSPQELRCPEMVAEWISPNGLISYLECPGPLTVRIQDYQAEFTAAPGERLNWFTGDHRLEAQHAILYFDSPEWRPHTLDLDGDIRYRQLKGSASSLLSQAWAQRAHVDLPSYHLTLTAEAPLSVTLWNRSTTQELACQRLQVWRDPMTQEWMQKGEGQVRVRVVGDDIQKMAKAWPEREDDGDDDDDAPF